MRFSNVAKVGCFLDGVGHSLEERRGEDVKVITLTLRISPFDAKLATAMPDGVKSTLFKLNSGDPKEALRRVDFALGCDRQLLKVFASPDTGTATMALDQVKIHDTYARAMKDSNGYEFVFRATFGPVGRDELEFVQGWLLTQKFITFIEAEPGMFDAPEDDEDEDDDEAPTVTQPTPMFDTAGDGRPLEGSEATASAPADGDDEPARQRLHSHAQGKAAPRRGRKAVH